MTEFLTFTIVGLSLAAIYAVTASGLVLTYTTTGIFNFAHGAIGMLGAFTYWQLRFDWGWPTPSRRRRAPRARPAVRRVPRGRRSSAGCKARPRPSKLVVSISLLFSMIGLANWIWEPDRSAQRDEVLRRRRAVDVGRRTDHVPPGDHDRRRDPRRDRAALPAVPHPGRDRDARRGRRPPARGAERRPARPRRRCSRGRSAPRSPRSAASSSPARRRSTPRRLAAHRQRVRGRDHRPAAQPAAHVRRRAHPRPADGLPAGLPRRENNQYLDRRSRRRDPGHLLFIVLLVLPNPRLRAQGIARSREFFPMPTMRGALHLRGA